MGTPCAGDPFGPSPSILILPRYVSVACLVWVMHDYFVTLEDEVTYFWSQKLKLNVLTFYWIRYYTIFLVLFDSTDTLTVKSSRAIIYSLVLGAIGLWSIEIVMQLRIYILFNRSKRVALVNGILFAISIAIFLWILIGYAVQGKEVHAPSEVRGTSEVPWGRPPPPPPGHGPPPPPGQGPPLPGHGPPPPPSEFGETCPPLNEDFRWLQWAPATLFEFVLFGMAVYKAIVSSSAKVDINGRRSLAGILLTENIVYFAVAACVLVFTNVMFVCQTNMPWLGFGPFHAALGIATGRLLIHLRKFAKENLEARASSRMTGLLPNLDVSLAKLPESTP